MSIGAGRIGQPSSTDEREIHSRNEWSLEISLIGLTVASYCLHLSECLTNTNDINMPRGRRGRRGGGGGKKSLPLDAEDGENRPSPQQPNQTSAVDTDTGTNTETVPAEVNDVNVNHENRNIRSRTDPQAEASSGMYATQTPDSETPSSTKERMTASNTAKDQRSSAPNQEGSGGDPISTSSIPQEHEDGVTPGTEGSNESVTGLVNPFGTPMDATRGVFTHKTAGTESVTHSDSTSVEEEVYTHGARARRKATFCVNAWIPHQPASRTCFV